MLFISTQNSLPEHPEVMRRGGEGRGGEGRGEGRGGREWVSEWGICWKREVCRGRRLGEGKTDSTLKD